MKTGRLIGVAVSRLVRILEFSYLAGSLSLFAIPNCVALALMESSSEAVIIAVNSAATFLSVGKFEISGNISDSSADLTFFIDVKSFPLKSFSSLALKSLSKNASGWFFSEKSAWSRKISHNMSLCPFVPL